MVNDTHLWMFPSEVIQHDCCSITAPIVNDDHFVIACKTRQKGQRLVNHLPNGIFIVVSGEKYADAWATPTGSMTTSFFVEHNCTGEWGNSKFGPFVT